MQGLWKFLASQLKVKFYQSDWEMKYWGGKSKYRSKELQNLTFVYLTSFT